MLESREWRIEGFSLAVGERRDSCLACRELEKTRWLVCRLGLPDVCSSIRCLSRSVSVSSLPAPEGRGCSFAICLSSLFFLEASKLAHCFLSANNSVSALLSSSRSSNTFLSCPASKVRKSGASTAGEATVRGDDLAGEIGVNVFGDCETPLVCEGSSTGKCKDSFFVWVVRSDIDVLLGFSASCTAAVFAGDCGGSAGKLVSIVISMSFRVYSHGLSSTSCTDLVWCSTA